MLAIMLAAFLAIGAGEPAAHSPAPDASAWLQERLDRILARTGKAPGDVKAVITDTTELPWTHPAASLQFPRALLVMAPSAEAVDGMLAMLLSFGLETEKRSDPAPTISLGSSSSFSSDPKDQRDARTGPVPKEQAEERREKAWQGARWNSQIGNCAAVQVDFLRATGKEARITLAGKPSVWPGSPFSRKVIEYLGAQAYPAEQRCRTREDPTFAAIQQSLQSATGKAEPGD